MDLNTTKNNIYLKNNLIAKGSAVSVINDERLVTAKILLANVGSIITINIYKEREK